jgi:hypothetical protein
VLLDQESKSGQHDSVPQPALLRVPRRRPPPAATRRASKSSGRKYVICKDRIQGLYFGKNE